MQCRRGVELLIRCVCDTHGPARQVSNDSLKNRKKSKNEKVISEEFSLFCGKLTYGGKEQCLIETTHLTEGVASVTTHDLNE